MREELSLSAEEVRSIERKYMQDYSRVVYADLHKDMTILKERPPRAMLIQVKEKKHKKKKRSLRLNRVSIQDESNVLSSSSSEEYLYLEQKELSDHLIFGTRRRQFTPTSGSSPLSRLGTEEPFVLGSKCNNNQEGADKPSFYYSNNGNHPILVPYASSSEKSGIKQEDKKSCAIS